MNFAPDKATLDAELDGIARWVRDSGNASGVGEDDWEWDFESRILTIREENGSVTKFTGAEIAASSPDDKRLNRLRI
jgi:hypothetical protein